MARLLSTRMGAFLLLSTALESAAAAALAPPMPLGAEQQFENRGNVCEGGDDTEENRRSFWELADWGMVEKYRKGMQEYCTHNDKAAEDRRSSLACYKIGVSKPYYLGYCHARHMRVSVKTLPPTLSPTYNCELGSRFKADAKPHHFFPDGPAPALGLALLPCPRCPAPPRPE